MGLIPSNPESRDSWQQAVYVEANYLNGPGGNVVHIVDVSPSEPLRGDRHVPWTRLVIVTNDHGQVSVTKLP